MSKHVGTATYLGIWLSLLGLTALSYLLSFLRLGSPSLFVALGIAAIKASLVALFFMHLIEQRFSNRLTLGVAAFLVALLCTLTALDVRSRHTFPPAPQVPLGGLVTHARAWG
jgi:cytochrome c oxidase subunit 4